MKVCLIVHVCVPVSRLVVSNSCDPLDCSPPGFSVHGIFPARMLEQVAIFSSMGSFGILCLDRFHRHPYLSLSIFLFPPLITLSTLDPGALIY